MNDDAATMPQRLPGLVRVLLICLMIGLGVAYLTPFTLMALGSLKKSISFIPDLNYMLSELTLANFAYIIGRNQFPRWFLNSVIFSVVPVMTQAIICTLIGYVLARRDFYGKNVFFMVMLAMVMIPTQLMVIPQYILFDRLDWINRYWAILVPDLWAVIGVFFARQYMQTIPREIDEAASIDGATDWQTFFRLIMPLAAPAIATIATFRFIWNWNDLFRPLIFMLSERMFPLSVGLAALYSLEGNFGVQMAAATLAFIPTFLTFLFFQRYFTQGVQMSGIK
ncbi:MAG: carbohydrate ABC transporter permease [Caldilineaceae bacterium]|nr:carbohydrate ABC transporter permease [Caldilineaceae bacterium]